MKRTLSMLLALALAAGLAVPALASETETAVDGEYAINDMMLVPGVDAPSIPAPEQEQSADQTDLEAELTDLILQVKTTLEVDNDYADLSSDYYDGITPQWSFTWSDDDRELTAQVRQDGTIVSTYYWEADNTNTWFYGFDPAFPPLTGDQARQQAQEWLDKLFVGEESARIDGVYTVLGKDGCYRYQGTVEKNGLPSPITFTMVIDGSGLNSFDRSDSHGGYVGSVPPAEPAAAEDKGAAGLAGAVEMELYYVSDGEGNAELRYVPVGPYTVVDAQSGETVDMEALYASFGGGAMENGMYAKGTAMPMAEEAMSDAGAVITEVEQASIGQYGDVLDGSVLDRQLRQLTALGLDAFQLQRCSYSMGGDGETITANMRYVSAMTAEQLYGYTLAGFQELEAVGGDLSVYKSISVNAKTGELLSVYTTYPLWERDEAVTMTDTNRTRAAENFLSLAAPELAKEAAICTLDGYNEDETVTFAQTHEGYFFPENSVTIDINPGSGTVDSFFIDWDEDVRFGPAEDVITPAEAAAAYADALDVTLGYVAWPLDITLEENAVYADLLAMGYTYVEELRLAWYYEGKDAVSGVDALTGQVLTAERKGETTYAYDDLDGVAQAEQIEALAQAGVGFEGGKFLPEAELTCRDAVTLLLRAAGMSPGPSDDTLRDAAVREGFVPAEEDFDADAVLSRMGFAKMLLRSSRYGDAAELLSLKPDQGYNVIALALGMDVSDPDGTATRADAAGMLYAFMSR